MRVRGSSLRSDFQDGRLHHWLESMSFDESIVAPGPRKRAAVSVYFSDVERARLRGLGSLFGLGVGQVARVFVLHGVRSNGQRLDWARELGYDIE